MKHLGEYRTEAFPTSRLATIDIGIASQMKHHIKALIELDVTDARKMIREKKKQNLNISFNSWLIKCISKAVEEFSDVHGIRKGKKKIVIFDDIDISIMIEREIQREKVPLPYVIRKTNEKNISEICNEIKAGQSQSINDEGNYVLGEKKNEYLMKIYYSMPGFIRRMVWRKIIRSPFLTKQNMGTVIITSVGMMGKINGWVVPVSVHPLSFAVGSIIKKPGVKDDRIEIREYLYMTVSVDHDVIDGAPAVRVLSKLANLIEKGFGLS
ncbi:MAG: 2-oxo acid dehydrogenase subunit E2 [Clostridia bacterium]|nr:2-oxo acid dehydrogenase subunit E2 [Clostridia bacterium]